MVPKWPSTRSIRACHSSPTKPRYRMGLPPATSQATRNLLRRALAVAIPAVVLILASPARAEPSRPFGEDICRVLAQAAADNGLPVELFTRLIWQESRFNPNAISPRGALGIAQFMPR